MPDPQTSIVDSLVAGDTVRERRLPSADLFPRSFRSILSYPVHDEIVLHDRRESEGQLVALNTTGRAVWDLCDGFTSISEISGVLSESFEAPKEVLHEDVRAILADLRGRNLIEFSRVRAESRKNVQTEVIRVAFNACQVHIYTDIEEIKVWLRRRFQAMLTDKPGRVVRQIGISKLDGDYHVSGCSRTPAPEASLREVRRSIKHEIDRGLVGANPNLIWLHAGAVSSEKGAVLFGGDYGSGKSTVVSNLYSLGWTYLSDDIIPLDPASGSAVPFPLTPMYRINNGEYLAEEKVSNLERIWVDLHPDTVGRDPVRIQGFVFPKYDLSVDARLEPVQSGEALVQLIQHCMNFRLLGGEALRGLSTLIEGRKIFRLMYSDGGAAARLVESEFGS